MMKKTIYKILVLFGLIVILACVFPFTKSRYEKSMVATFKNEVAVYLFETSVKNIPIEIESLSPSDEPYVYSFTVSNNDGKNISEVSIEYDLYVKTTTNLPLQYELYLNEDYTSNNATNLFENEELIQDEYGTYYRKVSINTRYFGYEQMETDRYTLLITFPKIYNSEKYQNLIESIELYIDSRQIID